MADRGLAAIPARVPDLSDAPRTGRFR